MARRPITPKPPKTYLYQSDEECEQAEETGARHLVEVKTWPPPRSRAGEANPCIPARCKWCNCQLLVYGDNDPDQSGIEVKVLDKDPLGHKK